MPNDSTVDAWRYVDRMTARHEPHCPCGLRAFAPALAQLGDTGGHVVFWCTDHGHWAGDETEVTWKLKDEVPA